MDSDSRSWLITSHRVCRQSLQTDHHLASFSKHFTHCGAGQIMITRYINNNSDRTLLVIVFTTRFWTGESIPRSRLIRWSGDTYVTIWKFFWLLDIFVVLYENQIWFRLTYLWRNADAEMVVGCGFVIHATLHCCIALPWESAKKNTRKSEMIRLDNEFIYEV